MQGGGIKPGLFIDIFEFKFPVYLSIVQFVKYELEVLLGYLFS